MLDPRRYKKKKERKKKKVHVLDLGDRFAFLLVLQLRSDTPRECPVLTFLCKLLQNGRNRSY